MKVDLQNFRYGRLKNIKMDGFLEGDLLLLLLLRRQRKRALHRALKCTKHMFWVRNIFRKHEKPFLIALDLLIIQDREMFHFFC